MIENYIRGYFDDIIKYASVLECRLDDKHCTMESVLEDNALVLELCKKFNINYLLIDNEYQIDISL